MIVSLFPIGYNGSAMRRATKEHGRHSNCCTLFDYLCIITITYKIQFKNLESTLQNFPTLLGFYN
jgi:hypothetical protein